MPSGAGAGLPPVSARVFPLKTNEKSTFWLLVPTRCLKKAFKTNEKSTFLLLGPGATILGTKKVPLKPILFQHFGFGGVLGVSWGRLGPSWGVLGPLGASWGRLGVVLGPSWGVLGSSWVRLGGVLGRLGGILGASWAVLGCLGVSWGPLGVSKKLLKSMKNQHFCFWNLVRQSWGPKKCFKTNTFS